MTLGSLVRAALGTTTTWRVSSNGRTLRLSGADGDPVLTYDSVLR